MPKTNKELLEELCNTMQDSVDKLNDQFEKKTHKKIKLEKIDWDKDGCTIKSINSMFANFNTISKAMQEKEILKEGQYIVLFDNVVKKAANSVYAEDERVAKKYRDDLKDAFDRAMDIHIKALK